MSCKLKEKRQFLFLFPAWLLLCTGSAWELFKNESSSFTLKNVHLIFSTSSLSGSPVHLSKSISFPTDRFSKSLESFLYSVHSDILFIVVHLSFKWIKSISSGIKKFVNIYRKVSLIRTEFSWKEGYLTTAFWLYSWTLFKSFCPQHGYSQIMIS